MSAPRTVFRTAALRRHEAPNVETAVLRPVTPRTALCLWILLGLLATGAAVATVARFPVVAEGRAIVGAAPDEWSTATEHAVVLLRLSESGNLNVGQTVTLEFPGSGRLKSSVSAVVPGVVDFADTRHQWESIPVAAIEGVTPAVVVIVPLGPASGGTTSMVSAGSIGRAQVEVDSRSVGSLLPLVGRLFGG